MNFRTQFANGKWYVLISPGNEAEAHQLDVVNETLHVETEDVTLAQPGDLILQVIPPIAKSDSCAGSCDNATS